MGYGCTREEERVLASKGLIQSAPVKFEDNKDIPLGGVLLALPALLENGLLKYIEKYYKLRDGFYSIINIFIVFAFMFLLRLKSPENLRSVSPGEFGKLIGLDRVPEVKTLRCKLSELSSQEKAKAWNLELSEYWMSLSEEDIGVFYIDGHIKIYNGSLTQLPAKYVARQRLCLSGTIDYWVNDYIGQPFFVIRKSINQGLIKTINEEIIPELVRIAPNQPSEEELRIDNSLHRFLIIFDREGYSPEFFIQLWEKRIACCTYRKYVTDKWSLSEFRTHKVILKTGETIDMHLAERGTFIGKKIWVREIRKLTSSGHQTSIISTDFKTETGVLALSMFSRWSQENFFKYMMEHYGIDRLIEYETDDIDDTTKVVNPAYRILDSNIRSLSGKFQRKTANLVGMDINLNASDSQRIKIENKRSELLEEIELLQKEISELKFQRKSIDKHIYFRDLPDNYKFSGLAMEKKLLVDTIKMICYRAETSLVTILREHMSNKDEARSLIRQIFDSEIDLSVDSKNKVLNVNLHNLSTQSKDRSAYELIKELNKTETVFPGTDLCLKYNLVALKNP